MPDLSNSKLIIYIALIFLLFWEQLYSTIPLSAKEDARFELGYLVVTYYPGVRNDGTGDSRVGIQEAIIDAFENDLVVLFPPGTYLVSDVLKCYYWGFWDFSRNRESNPPGRKAHVLVGSYSGEKRPLIKLAPDAIGFDNPAFPRPVVVWRYFSAENTNATTKVEPENPLTGDPPNFYNKPNVIFGWEFRNIDIDVNNHPGAIGGAFNGAQCSAVIDCRINANNGYCGIFGVPGRNSFISNIEVEGGRYGVYNNGDAAGACLIGAKLYNQTHFAVTSEDFCPYSMVGLEIITNAPRAIYVKDKTWYSSGNSTFTLVDCKIQMGNGGTAIDNSVGKSIYMSNIYIKGATNLVQSGNQPPLNGNEKWERIIEYTYNDQRAANGLKIFDTYSLINGELSQTPEPDTQIEESNPNENLTTRHLVDDLPFYEGENSETVNVKKEPFYAVGDGIHDDWEAIQGAIDGTTNGYVFLPKGNYVISKPLMLKSNTKLFGLNQNYSILYSTYRWAAGNSRAMVETVNDANASTYFCFIGFQDESISASNVTEGFIHWKAGKNSTIMMCRHMKKWGSYYGSHTRYNYHFSGSAGGRHFIAPHQEEGASSINGRQVFIENTTQPIIFYGLNMECTKTRTTGDIDDLGTNLEIVNSSNIRIHSIKREGRSPTVVIHDSENIGIYGMGRLNFTVTEGLGAYNQISGTSNNIVLAAIVLDNKVGEEGFSILTEDILGIPKIEIPWPNNISIYKRGDLTDIFDDLQTGLTDLNKSENKINMFCYPNPAQKEIFIRVVLARKCNVNIAIYDIVGRKVKTMNCDHLTVGDNQIYWDGKNSNGENVKSGTYFIKLKSSGITTTKKVIIG